VWYLEQYPAAERDAWASWMLPLEVLKKSPSRADHVPPEEERRYRRRTCIFLEELAEKSLQVDWQSLATAQIFLHFFFARHSFRRHNRFEVAIACIFLAAKCEECAVPNARRLEKIISKAHRLMYEPALLRDGGTYTPLDTASEAYKVLQSDVLVAERALLHTIAFDLITYKPHKYFKYLFEFIMAADLVPSELHKEFGRCAMQFLKMAMRTSLVLQFEPPKMAAAAIWLSTIYLDFAATADGASGSSGSSSSGGSGGGNNALEWRVRPKLGLDVESFRAMTEQVLEVLQADRGSATGLAKLDAFETVLLEKKILRYRTVVSSSSSSSSHGRSHGHSSLSSSSSSSSSSAAAALTAPPMRRVSSGIVQGNHQYDSDRRPSASSSSGSSSSSSSSQRHRDGRPPPPPPPPGGPSSSSSSSSAGVAVAATTVAAAAAAARMSRPMIHGEQQHANKRPRTEIG